MASQDFSIYSGDSKTLTVTVTDGNNSAVNLTGATIKWTVVNAGSSIVLKTVGSGITITNATSGQFSITLTSSDTQNLSGTYTHEARLIDSSGNSSIIFIGNLTVTKSYV